MIRKQLDCRKKENKSRFLCKVNKFCNKKEHTLTIMGKGLISLTSPVVGTSITAYELGKSITCSLQKRLR